MIVIAIFISAASITYALLQIADAIEGLNNG